MIMGNNYISLTELWRIIRVLYKYKCAEGVDNGLCFSMLWNQQPLQISFSKREVTLNKNTVSCVKAEGLNGQETVKR